MALTCIKTMGALATFAALIAASAGAGARAQPAADADILAVREAVQKGQWKTLEALRPRFAGHVLEAYPSYWLLVSDLERADPAEVQAFLARYADTPLAESLRREWLKMLGGSGAWELFRAEHPKLLSDDAEITCYSLQERLRRGDAEAIDEAHALFVAAREAPAACESVFASLAASRQLTQADVWARIRKLLAAGSLKDAKRANALLATREGFHDRTLDRAASDPSAFLAREKSAHLARSAQELVLFSLGRLARTRVDEAAERLAMFAARLGPEAAREAWGQIAWQAALEHHASALEWYARAEGAPLSDTQIAWKARAALRAGDWKTVLAAIQALSAEEARESTWRYWRARALRALGAGEAAEAHFRVLAREAGFYGLLAAEELGIASAPQWNGWRPQLEDLERIRSIAGIRRALALYRAGLEAEALREWWWSTRSMGDRDLLAAAEVARLAEVPDRAIFTAERTVQLHDFSQRFPTPHRETLSAAARQWDVDEALLYGLIRQESRFVTEARSRAGAMGLMQVMPSTARWVARQIPVRDFRVGMLTRPEVNVNFGSYYFHRVLFDLGDAMMATAAYNAGPGRARRWRDARALEGAIYAETIPFSETRDYVKKVITNAWFYRHKLTGHLASIRQLLGTVPGRNGEPQSAVASYIP